MPVAGSHPSFRANSSDIIWAIQKPGIDAAIRAANMEALSFQEYWFTAAMMPSGTPTATESRTESAAIINVRGKRSMVCEETHATAPRRHWARE